MTEFETRLRSLSEGGIADVSRRFSATHPLDFFVYLDSRGEPGLQLRSVVEPPAAPSFHALETTISKRPDGSWILSISLADSSLLPIFCALCQNLIDSSVQVSQSEAAAFVVSNLYEWRDLLKRAQPGLLEQHLCRGLLGELVVLSDLLGQGQTLEPVRAWVGPLGAPQDFAFGDRLIEVKAILPSADCFGVSSLEQLEPSIRALFLAAVTIKTEASIAPNSTTLPIEVNKIRELLRRDRGAFDLFEMRLTIAGYSDNPAYSDRHMTVGEVRCYSIGEKFPRLVRSAVDAAIVRARYEISLAAIEPYRCAREVLYGSC